MWRLFKIFNYKVTAKVYKEESAYGMKELPRVSKLSIYKGDKALFNFDRGLDFNDLPPVVYKSIIKVLGWLI